MQLMKPWLAKKPLLTRAWTFNVKSPILTVPVLVEFDNQAVVVFGTKKGSVMAVAEGKLLWEYKLTSTVSKMEQYFYEEETLTSIVRTPLVADINGDGKPEIIFGAENSTITALDIYGKKLWEFKCVAPIRSGVVLFEKQLVFGDMNGIMYFLKTDGKLIRKFSANAAIRGGLLVKGTQILFGTEKGTVYCLNSTGKLVWTFEAKSAIVNTPALSGETIIIGTKTGDVFALAADGIMKWQYRAEGSIETDFTIADIEFDKREEILIAVDNVLHVLSSEGGLLWSYDASMWIRTKPLVMDLNSDKKLEVVIGSLDGNIYILESQRTYSLNYMPGLAGVGMQHGHYNNLLTEPPGVAEGKLIMKVPTSGMITGLVYSSKHSLMVASLYKGQILGFKCKTE